SEEQSTTSQQIASSIEMISRVSETSAQGIHAVSQTTGTLTQLTSSLNEVVDRFQMEGAAA
ncbi:MAG: methyl-accepting chemotaxis protein, partial [Bacteroidota bacterium]